MPIGSQPNLKIAPIPKLNTSFNPESMMVNEVKTSGYNPPTFRASEHCVENTVLSSWDDSRNIKHRKVYTELPSLTLSPEIEGIE